LSFLSFLILSVALVAAIRGWQRLGFDDLLGSMIHSIWPALPGSQTSSFASMIERGRAAA
jgi:hypothetical protein